MASLTDYKYVKIVEEAVDAGGALTNNFKELAKGAPFVASRDPGTGDNASLQYGAGQLWINSATNTIWMCVSASTTTASWKAIASRSDAVLSLGDGTSQVSVAGKLSVVCQNSAEAMTVQSTAPGGGAARFHNSNAGMQIFIDATPIPDASEEARAVFQLRNASTPAADRTLVGRNFSSAEEPDEFKIEHLVGSNLMGTLRINGTGQFCFFGPGNIGLGTPTPKAKLHSTGSTILGVANSAVADDDLSGGQVNIHVNQTNNTLVFKVKYSNGTVKTGTVALS